MGGVWWTKTLASISFLPLILAGCVSLRSADDDFASLHRRVEHLLAGRSTNGPIVQNETLGRFFDITPRDSACRIVVVQREFLTQWEWKRQYSEIMAQVSAFLNQTNQTASGAGLGIAAIERMQRLPEWSYRKTGVDMTVQSPEVVYPESAKENAQAQGLLNEIAGVLKPYRQADRSDGARSRQAFNSHTNSTPAAAHTSP